MPLAQHEGRIRLRQLLDRASVEAFGNDGEADLSNVFYPDPENRTLTLQARGGSAWIRRARIHRLRSIYGAR